MRPHLRNCPDATASRTRSRPSAPAPRPAHGTLVRRVLAAVCAALVPLALWAAPARAHIEPEPAEVPAGGTATVAFTVQHGCEGSPTVKVELQVPDGVTGATPVEQPGWTGSVDGDVVTFEGGPLPDATEHQFAITFDAPDAPGSELRFPVIQTCEEGSIDWIAADHDAENPAPVVSVGQADPSATTTSTADETTTTTTAATSTTEPASSSTTAVTSTTAVPLEDRGTVEDEDDDSSALPWIIGGVLVVAAIGAVAYAASRRRDETDVPGEPGPPTDRR